jgi:hypothetical protein
MKATKKRGAVHKTYVREVIFLSFPQRAHRQSDAKRAPVSGGAVTAAAASAIVCEAEAAFTPLLRSLHERLALARTGDLRFMTQDIRGGKMWDRASGDEQPGIVLLVVLTHTRGTSTPRPAHPPRCLTASPQGATHESP